MGLVQEKKRNMAILSCNMWSKNKTKEFIYLTSEKARQARNKRETSIKKSGKRKGLKRTVFKGIKLTVVRTPI